MMSKQKKRGLIIASSVKVVTIHRLPTGTWNMALITQLFMIHRSPAITQFYIFMMLIH